MMPGVASRQRDKEVKKAMHICRYKFFIVYRFS
jgi:hypothetical protein